MPEGVSGLYNPEGDWVPAPPPQPAYSPQVHAMLRAIEDGLVEKAFHAGGRWRRTDGRDLTRDDRRAMEKILRAHWIDWSGTRGSFVLDLMPEAQAVLRAWDDECSSSGEVRPDA